MTLVAGQGGYWERWARGGGNSFSLPQDDVDEAADERQREGHPRQDVGVAEGVYLRHPLRTHHRVDDGAAHHEQAWTGRETDVNAAPGLRWRDGPGRSAPPPSRRGCSWRGAERRCCLAEWAPAGVDQCSGTAQRARRGRGEGCQQGTQWAGGGGAARLKGHDVQRTRGELNHQRTAQPLLIEFPVRPERSVQVWQSVPRLVFDQFCKFGNCVVVLLGLVTQRKQQRPFENEPMLPDLGLPGPGGGL